MPVHGRSGGVWRETTPSGRSGGAWRSGEKMFGRSGGVWREAWDYSLFTEGYMSGSGSRLEHKTQYDGRTSLLAYAYDGSINEYVSTMVTKVPVNLTGVSEITFRYTTPEAWQSDSVHFVVSTSQMGNYGVYDVSSFSLNSARFNSTYSMNVGSLSGSYYIRAHAVGRYYQGFNAKRLFLHQISLDGVTFFNGSN